MTPYTSLKNSGLFWVLGPIRQSKRLAKYRLLFTITALLCSLMTVQGQTLLRWTGNANNEFHNPNNWSPQFSPAGNNLVILDNGGNAPVVSTSIVIHNIGLNSSADLTIEEGVTLTLNATSQVVSINGILYNTGTIVNHGTINIIGSSTEPYAINNEGSITNESTFPGGTVSVAAINVFTTTGIGIYSTGTFVNRGGTINVGTLGTIGGDGIYVADGLFNTLNISFPNPSVATMNIANTTGDGIGVDSNGVFTMTSGALNLGVIGVIGDHSINNAGSFNANGGSINVARATSNGINNQLGATFTNNTTAISIGTSPFNVDYGIQNFGTFINDHTVDIHRAVFDGIENLDSAQFINRAGASVTIGSIQAVGVTGLENKASFTNRGIIDIKSADSEGLITVSANGNFDNLAGGIVNIGTTGGSIGRIGLWVVGNSTFTNNASTINVGNTGSIAAPGIGLYTQDMGSMINENGALINIGQNSNSIGSSGIVLQVNSSMVNRNSTIKVDNTGGSGIQGWDGAVFQNVDSGIIDIGQNQGNIGGSGLTLINTLFFNDASIINIDRVGEMGVDIQQDADLSNQNSSQLNIGMNGGFNTIPHFGFGVFGLISNNNSTINVNNTGNNAIFLGSGSITNEGSSGQINIGTSGGVRNISGAAIECDALFQNVGGTIQINNTDGDGIFVSETGRFNNGFSSILKIGTNGSNTNIKDVGINVKGVFQNLFSSVEVEQTGSYGIFLSGIDNPSFSNVTNSSVNIANTDDIGLRVGDGTFDNAADLTIGDTNGDAFLAINNTSLDNSGGTLTVDGLIRNITAVEGTLAPGNSPGEMRSHRALDISSATLEIEIDGLTPITEHDVLQINGLATIANAGLSVSLNYTPSYNDRIVFLKASNISGTFNNPALPADWSLDYSVSGEVALVYDGTACLVSPKILLQGPYNTTNALLNDDLRVAGFVPIVEPYSGLSGFTHVNGGGESIIEAVYNVTGNNAIVDWVFLELRDANNPTTVLHTRSALLQRDGDIVEVTGGSDPVVFPLATVGDYYVTVRHRNHLGIRTTSTLSLSSAATTAYDFTSTAAQAHGTNPMIEVSTGVWAMWGGNAKADDNYVRVTPRVFPPPSLASDRTYILDVILNGDPNGTFNGYSTGDINMDGFVRLTPRVFPPPSLESDATFILDEVLEGDPNATRTEQ